MNREWKKYERIVLGLSYKFSITIKEPIEDLYQEGYICFHELVEKEKKTGLTCPFEAALSTCVTQVFINFFHKKKAQKRSAILLDISKMVDILGYNPVHFMDKYLSFSEEIQELVNLFITTPKELTHLLRRENFKKAVTIYLKEFQGWENPRIRTLWNEIEEKFVV